MLRLYDQILTCFLFDLDGTLVKTHIDFDKMRATVNELALGAGASLPEQSNTTILETAKYAADSLGDEEGNKLWRTTLLALEEVELEGCANAESIPGAQELLLTLVEENIKIGIVTRNCRRVSMRLLSEFALPYDILLTRDDVAKTKPDPAHLHDALVLLGCDPSSTAMVGDHWLDMQAGKAAGCAVTVGVLGARNEEYFGPCRPDILIKDMAELLTSIAGFSSESDVDV
jgi:phosphoglycolate phosphatase